MMLRIMKHRKLHVIFSIVTMIIGLSSLTASAVTIEEVLKTYLSENYPWNDIEISDVRTIGEQIQGIPEKIVVEKGPLGRAAFSLYVSGERTIVKANIKAYTWVVKSTRSLSKGHIIEEHDMYTEQMEIGRLPKGAIRSIENIIGKSLKRSIVANVPVVENMIQRYQVVKRGKLVELVIGNANFSISASGKTKEKGYVGKEVRAVNLTSKKIVTGILINKSTVKVEL